MTCARPGCCNLIRKGANQSYCSRDCVKGSYNTCPEALGGRTRRWEEDYRIKQIRKGLVASSATLAGR